MDRFYNNQQLHFNRSTVARNFDGQPESMAELSCLGEACKMVSHLYSIRPIHSIRKIITLHRLVPIAQLVVTDRATEQ